LRYTENLIAAVRRKGTRNLTIVSNNGGVEDCGVGLLLQTRQVKKMISTYIGEISCSSSSRSTANSNWS